MELIKKYSTSATYTHILYDKNSKMTWNKNDIFAGTSLKKYSQYLTCKRTANG